ncbi:MAG: rhodanese-like domain-containing protein [Gammaproteobacteria bacterium]|nr:rhodanese-like domain-containing protein [Gammaproteobacteria bacterium]
MMHSTGFLKIAEDAKKKVNEIELTELQQRLSTQANIFLVDVREKEEYQQGAVSWAIHLSKGVIERDIEKTIPDKTAEIVLYCGGGSRSALAAENLQRMGYKNVYSLAGGYRGIRENPSDVLR